MLVVAGCGTAPAHTRTRPFQFQSDTFAYANQLVWEYYHDDAGNWRHRRREPAPDYTHRCFVVARAAKQFFLHARFEPDLPKADASVYRARIREVIARSPRRSGPDASRVVIPGYRNLREFSEAHAALLKEACGGPWQSYFQRGHWRVIAPFSRAGQERTAADLAEAIRENRAPVIHLIRFPSLRINHAMLLFESRDSGGRIEFSAYDPNAPEAPVRLTFDRDTRRFDLPENAYFPGGWVDVYEVYSGFWY